MCLTLPFSHTSPPPSSFLKKEKKNVFVTSLKLEESVHLAQLPTTVSQEEGDYGSRVHTVNSVLEQRCRQHKAVHLAFSALGLQFPQSGPGFMGSFSASLPLSLQLFWKAKVKLKTMTEQI